MKSFIVKIILFFALVAVIDLLFGKCCDYLYKHSVGGDSFRINYAISEGTADVLIMGSSRANHHYNPKILSDSLGMEVMNLGVDGSGVILMDGFYRLIVQRYSPKYIIYELTPSFDFQQYAGDVDNTRYLSQLKPYYKAACIAKIFDDIDANERIKLHSGLYRYNTSFLNLIKYYFKDGDNCVDGFTPLQGVMADSSHSTKQVIPRIDSLKIKYLHQFIQDCKNNGTKLIFTISPKYGATSSIEYQPGIDVLRNEGYEVLDYYCDPRFVLTKEFFKDSYHLNSIGADAFTEIIAHTIHNSL